MKWGRKLVLLVALLIMATAIQSGMAVAQDYQDYWVKAYGGKNSEVLFNLDKFSDGSIIAVGYTYSFGAGKSDALVVKFDSEGRILWAKSLGGERYDGLYTVAVSDDGSVVMVGFYGASEIYYSSFGLVYGKYGDLWVVKLDSDGNVLWQRSFGGPKTDSGLGVTIASNGDIIVAGYTTSFGSPNLWVLRLNSNGEIIWQRVYRLQNAAEFGWGIDLDPSANIVIAGSLGSGKALLLKLNPYGIPIWTKIYDGKNSEYFSGVRVEENGDILVVGSTSSFGQGGMDGLVMRLSSDGDVIWSKTYGGAYYDYLFRITTAFSGDILVTGYSKSFVDSDGDGWILRLNGYGNVIWQKVFYGRYIDILNGALELNDAIYAIGWTKSYGAGYSDAWLIKMPKDGGIECNICKDSKGIVKNAVFNVNSYEISYSEGNPAIADTSAVVQDIQLRETPIFGTVGTLRISSTPLGAEIYIDGEYKGTTPLELKLPEGKYTISIVKNGYIKWEEEIELRGGDVETISISLIPIQASTTATSTTTTTTTIQTSTTTSPSSENGDQMETSTATTTKTSRETSSTATNTPTSMETTGVITVTKTEKVSGLSICGPGVVILMAFIVLPLIKRRK
ncbi:PEGA domain-containing protein [Thermococcus sp. 18S1]|uniref:PEGA domain-containing protein n=1 Tax=Thermococcus sp. 18S1 TaxID=1638210 RepID=UPI00143870E2|nr:PEGA domain-containing protein [Thermococcus sp. 18S1]NJE29810.1 PEGA domain-containing protein [Thermococcus sp. 18S1]